MPGEEGKEAAEGQEGAVGLAASRIDGAVDG